MFEIGFKPRLCTIIYGFKLGLKPYDSSACTDSLHW